MNAADAEEIVKVLRSLPEKPVLKGSSRDWWPRFLYHYTDIQNAVRIVTQKKLLSRSKLEQLGQMAVDNASPEVLKNTRKKVKEFVRLYFRPRTPTQFHNEGIRPVGQRSALGAHCPVPIFFLFDSEKFFRTTDCYFSEGNLASSACTASNSARVFKALPFDSIYHDGVIPPDGRRQVVFHRSAEVIVPDELSLATLRYIFCRSPAEKETFLYLLPDAERTRWASKVVVDSKLNLFFRSGSFVESVRLTIERAIFTFSPDSQSPGPFDLHYSMVDSATKAKYVLNREDYMTSVPLRVKIPEEVIEYVVELKLGADLAYTNKFAPEEVPF